MSDEDSLGTVFFMPRRVFIYLLALGFLIYGACSAFYFTIFAYVHMANMTPSHHCSGPGCDDNLTCAGTQDASYHFRIAVMSIGSLYFGILGVNAVHNKYASDLFNFAWAMVAFAAVYFIVMCMDGSYLALCGNHYSYNTISEAVLWPIRGPVNNGIKHAIRQMNKYPAEYVNTLCFHNVYMMFACFYMARVIFFLFAAYQSFVLSQRFHYGLAGMGANFSIEGWRKRLMMRYEIDQVAHNTFGQYNSFDHAFENGMDLGYAEDEFNLKKPIRKPSSFRGAQAQAYDGFSDDRRNVLL